MLMLNEKYAKNLENWEFVRNLTKDEYKELGIKTRGDGRYNTRGYYKCRVCGKLKHIQKNHFKDRVMACDNGCHGIKYSNKFVTKENCTATTHPHLVKYFVNECDTYKYSAQSHKKVEMVCPDCGEVKQMIISNLTNHGFSCSSCSDGLSYPEKFMANMLSQLGLEYKTQFTYDNYQHRYDFYLPEYNTIIETHGSQHYNAKKNSRWKTLEEEQENDKYKYDLAVKNGIDHYIIIDSRYSTLDWMQKNIMSSPLPNLLGLAEDDVDWIEVYDKCQNSLVKEVCEYWNSHDTMTGNMQQIFGLSANTIRNYLKIGNELNFCKYDPKKEQYEGVRKAGLANSKKVQIINKETGEIIIFPSASEAGRKLNKSQTTISKRCRENSIIDNYTWSYID